MTDALREYVEMLFAYAPKTQAAYDLKEEIYANAVERYQDLVANGASEGDAYQLVIDGIGDVSDLFASLEDPPEYLYEQDLWRKKSALLLSICIGLYILAIIPVVFFQGDPLGYVAAISICILPTCLLVYRANAYPQNPRKPATVVEEFQDWRSNKKRRNKVRGAISTILWMSCLILYFLLSMITGAWHITWILFLVATCLEGVVNLLFNIRR